MTNSNAGFLKGAHTRLGRWAVGLLIAFFVMYIINSAVFMQLKGNAPWQHLLLPYYGILMMLCGLSAGILGLVAILRNHERSWAVWLSILPGAFVLFLLLGEFLIPH